MQDKIQEIMGLVDAYGTAVHDNSTGNPSNYTLAHAESAAYMAIESKLRELVREPLTPTQRMEILHSIPDDDDADSEWMLTDMQLQLIMDAVERAHGITNTSGVE